MSLEALNQAAAAQNALTERMNAFIDGIDQDIAAAQADYAALTNNLVGVVADQMDFIATWDPADANPTNVRNGTYASLAALIADTPATGAVLINVPAGQTVALDEDVSLGARAVTFMGHDANRATIEFASYEVNGALFSRYLSLRGTKVFFRGVDLRIGAKADPALDWHHSVAGLRTPINGDWPMTIGFVSCDISWAEGRGLIAPYVGELLFMTAYLVAVDGPCSLVGTLSSSVGLLAKHSLTLSNGASLVQVAGTLGVNLLEG